MAKRNITYLSETNLITCVLQTGLAEGVLDAAKNCGAQGATISLARGTGIRERMGLMGIAIDEQKEVIDKKREDFEAREKRKDAFASNSFPKGAQLCTKCNTAAAVMMDGCMTCLNCGYSKCG